jgi:hypothetical protein
MISSRTPQGSCKKWLYGFSMGSFMEVELPSLRCSELGNDQLSILFGSTKRLHGVPRGLTFRTQTSESAFCCLSFCSSLHSGLLSSNRSPSVSSLEPFISKFGTKSRMCKHRLKARDAGT